jgi:hypothetical protein
MRASRFLFVAAVPMLAVLSTGAVASRFKPTTMRARARQLDYLPQGWTQVLFKADPPPALITRKANLQAVLEASISLATDVTVTYVVGNPPTVLNEVDLSVVAPPVANQVKGIRCRETNGTCAISLAGRSDSAFTNDPRAVGVVLAAMRAKRPVEDLMLDSHNQIQRVKLSIP